MALPDELSVKSLLGLMSLFIGVLLHIIGLSTPEWSVSDFSNTNHFGIWQICDDNACRKMAKSVMPDGTETCETFAVIGMLAAVTSLVLGLTHFILAILDKSRTKPTPTFILATSIIACSCIFICVLIWGVSIHKPSHYSIGYSYILSVVGGLFLAVGGLLMFLGSNRVESSGICGHCEPACKAFLLCTGVCQRHDV